MVRLYILDTMYHIFRAFHALPPLNAPDGRPTNAVYGVLGILRNLWKTEPVEYLVAVFESLEGTFREELYPGYKAHRPRLEPELKVQVPLVEALFQRLGLQTLSVNGYEADDVIATLARRAVEGGYGATLVSNDKDLAQVLVEGRDVELLRLAGTGKKARVERIRPQEVESVFGVGPQLIPSLLALRGDPVDNIKGLPGVGQKTAVRLLRQHGDLHYLLDHPECAGRFEQALRENRERLLRDLEIATVRTDVPLDFEGCPLERFRPGPLRGARELFQELGMTRAQVDIDALLAPEPTVRDLWG